MNSIKDIKNGPHFFLKKKLFKKKSHQLGPFFLFKSSVSVNTSSTSSRSPLTPHPALFVSPGIQISKDLRFRARARINVLQITWWPKSLGVYWRFPPYITPKSLHPFPLQSLDSTPSIKAICSSRNNYRLSATPWGAIEPWSGVYLITETGRDIFKGEKMGGAWEFKLALAMTVTIEAV